MGSSDAVFAGVLRIFLIKRNVARPDVEYSIIQVLTRIRYIGELHATHLVPRLVAE